MNVLLSHSEREKRTCLRQRDRDGDWEKEVVTERQLLKRKAFNWKQWDREGGEGEHKQDTEEPVNITSTEQIKTDKPKQVC